MVGMNAETATRINVLTKTESKKKKRNMKELVNYLKLSMISLIVVAAFFGCEKTESKQATKDLNGSKSETKYVSGPYETNITIRRKFKWKVVNKPPSQSGCEKGRGLCISGDTPPENPNDFIGLMSNHPDDQNKIIFNFTDEFIEAEDELIIDGLFVIDTEVYIDEEMASILGFLTPITIQPGEYNIINDGEGWNSVIVDIL